MSSQASEVIHCPNCKEDVPKTLYCLNCGYPLYKLEQQKIIEEPAQESVTEPEEEVDMSVGIEPQEPTPEPVIEPEPEPEEESILEPEMEPEIATVIAVEEEPEPIEEESTPEPEIATVIAVEEEPEPIEEESTPEPEDVYIEPAEEYEEPEPEQVFKPEVKTDIFTPEERESYMMDEIKIEFAPDPLTKDVMESLAKNITLKIRLVRLLRESQVKEETFKKLFDSYVDQGRLWVGRRDEIVRRFKADILRMEQEIISARKDHELLEIRKNIGDASEEEYNVKAPAYKWDIENLDKEIKITRGSIQYVINLKGLIPEEEVEELIQMAESDYSELDDIEGITSDTIARMKETLAEAVNSLES